MVDHQEYRKSNMGRCRSCHWLNYWAAIILFVGLGLLFSSHVVVAQDSTSTAVAPEEISADDVNVIARELWCPLCSGVRLDACELKACEQMKEMIAVKLAEGQDLEEIRTYFVAQYGPQVLGEPPLEGFNWLAWVLPFVVLAIGGYVVWVTVRRMTRSTSTPLPERVTNQELSDEYEAKLAEELKRYG